MSILSEGKIDIRISLKFIAPMKQHDEFKRYDDIQVRLEFIQDELLENQALQHLIEENQKSRQKHLIGQSEDYIKKWGKKVKTQFQIKTLYERLLCYCNEK